MGKKGKKRKSAEGLDARLINAILTTPSLTAAAKAVNVSRATLYRRYEDDSFLEKLEEARGAALDRALDALQAGAEEIVKALLVLAKDKETGIRLRAVDRALFYILRAKEMRELEMRIDRLERITVAQEGRREA